MNFYYIVDYWSYPRSGFDLTKKSMVMRIFKEIMKTYSDEPDLEVKIDQYEAEYANMTVYSDLIESDKEITDQETEVMPTIRKQHPEAVLLLVKPIPASAVKTY